MLEMAPRIKLRTMTMSTARIRNVVTQAGFPIFNQLAKTPFNLVLEARP